MERNYVEYSLSGFSGLSLENNEPFETKNSPYIESIKLSDNLDTITVNLKKDVDFNQDREKREKIELFLKEMLFNLIIKDEVDIDCPKWRLENVCGNNKIALFEGIHCEEEMMVDRQQNSKPIYDFIVNSPTAIENNQLLYKRIFNILQNPNLIVQFMSLYEILYEKIQDIIDEGYGQEKVVLYLEHNEAKYPFVKFMPSRKKSKKGKKEDCFTYLRNQIAHCEKKDDVEEYKKIGLEITTRKIKGLLIVLNDVIMES